MYNTKIRIVTMILIIGLGNPGLKFKTTRHNLGFAAIDHLQKDWGISTWQNKIKFKSKISEGIVNNKKIILAKPQTFMNQSGQATSRLINFYKISLDNLWIIHDDIDLSLGQIKIIQNRGAAGHKGVQSIIDALNSKNFTRFRIGIKPELLSKKINKKDFVLEKISKKEELSLNKAKTKLHAAINLSLEKGIQKAMNEFN